MTGDEAWVHHVTPETKKASTTQCRPNKSGLKKVEARTSVSKVMASLLRCES